MALGSVPWNHARHLILLILALNSLLSAILAVLIRPR